MLRIFLALFSRFQTRHTADANLDFESELLSRHAERKAVLLRRAARYEDEGLHSVAAELREQAEAITLPRLLSSLNPPATPKPAAPRTKKTEPQTAPANGDTSRLPDLTKKRK